MSGEDPTDVLIVGGGVAGYTTARTLRDLGYDGPVTIIEQEPSCVDHPPLSKRALDEGTARTELELVPGGVVLPAAAHWEAARLDGQDAAARLLGRAPAPRGAAWYWTDRYGSHIEIVGNLVGEGVEIVRPGVAVFRVEGDRLVGAATVDDPMTVRAARRIIDRDVRVDRDALADPSVSLRRMLRS